MYHCNNCNYEFINPRTISDDIGDESYDVCPKCGDDNFDIMEDQND